MNENLEDKTKEVQIESTRIKLTPRQQALFRQLWDWRASSADTYREWGKPYGLYAVC